MRGVEPVRDTHRYVYKEDEDKMVRVDKNLGDTFHDAVQSRLGEKWDCGFICDIDLTIVNYIPLKLIWNVGVWGLTHKCSQPHHWNSWARTRCERCDKDGPRFNENRNEVNKITGIKLLCPRFHFLVGFISVSYNFTTQYLTILPRSAPRKKPTYTQRKPTTRNSKNSMITQLFGRKRKGWVTKIETVTQIKIVHQVVMLNKSRPNRTIWCVNNTMVSIRKFVGRRAPRQLWL